MSEAAPTSQLDFIERTVDVVAAYVSNNSLPSAELPALIASIHEALNTIGAGPVAPATESVERPTPAQIRKSIRPDGLISFIDGKSYKTLKRHLTKHGLDPQTYRERYGLPLPRPGRWREILNTDDADYGGSGVGNGGSLQSEDIAWHGRKASVALTLPPLATIVLAPE